MIEPLHDRRQEYQRSGYLVLKGVLPVALVSELGRFLQEEYHRNRELFQTRTGRSLDDHEFLRSIADAERFPALPSELKHLVRGELPLETRLDGRLKAVAHEPGLTAVVQAILNADGLRLHNPPSIRVSAPALSLGNVPLHQDHAYNPHLSEFVTAWVPFTPIDEACGGVDVLEGSHRLGPLEHGAQVIWGNFVAESASLGFERRHIVIGPGDALLFGPWLLHASHPNTSDRIRFSIDYRFFSASTPSSRHYYDIARRTVVAPPAERSGG